MSLKVVAPGIYADDLGRFWCRPYVHGRRTKRLLRATRLREAVAEANREKFRSEKDPFCELAKRYDDAGCPDRHFNERSALFLTEERRRLKQLVAFFGHMSIADIRPSVCPAYKAWRVKRVKRGTGERSVDMELVTLSNVLTYGVATNHIEFNVIKFSRPIFCRTEKVRQSWKVAPKSGDEVHALARILLDERKSAVLGWQLLFAAYTGCRTSELLRLRLDSKTVNEAGFMDGGYLFLGRRSKRGVNPWVPIAGVFKDMLKAFLAWRTNLGIKSPFFFYNRTKDGVIGEKSLGHAMVRAARALGLHHVTPHGLRSFYVTKRRGDGAADAQIAAEIGDSNPQMIPQSYGDLPANWSGGVKLDFVPVSSPPAWIRLALRWHLQLLETFDAPVAQLDKMN